MCGFVGLYSWKDRVTLSERQLVAMRDTMSPRGPDDAGLWYGREAGLTIGLAHRRLSIIDLSDQARQPMSTADGLLSLVFNGEIFNYREVRQSLVQTGRYEFRSQSDTEVLLSALYEWGVEECVRRIRGMYAFALYDRRDRSLTLVRDPLGVKPLYYWANDGMLVFASEIKAVLASDAVSRRINDEGLYHYLTFAHVPAPNTLFHGIFKLEAGTYLRQDPAGSRTVVRYWDAARVPVAQSRVDEREYVEELRRLLRQAVARRMVSDVPFGAFLSGGLDSTLNVALMAERLDRPVETYCIGLKGDAASEFESARLAARTFKTNHHEIEIDSGDFIRFLARMAYVQDEPLADPVCVPLFYLSQLARRSGTPVIQVGEGSDELFAGYPNYALFARWEGRYFQPYLQLPSALRRYGYYVGRKFGSPEWSDALWRASEGHPLFLGNAIAFWDSEKDRLLKQKRWMHAPSSRYVADLMRSLAAYSPLDQIIRVELANRLPELLLMRVDKMTMANSIEARVPYLDEDVVQFALSLPTDLKIRLGQGKYLLRKAAEGLVPDAILQRKKWGFCGSATTMLDEKLIQYARATILHNALIAERFSLNGIHALFERHRRNPRFSSFKIWNLLNLALWHECWFEDQAGTGAPLSTEMPSRAGASVGMTVQVDSSGSSGAVAAYATRE